MRRRLLLLSLVALLGCARTVPQNVLFIVVDTLRGDALGVYGAERDTSPALDAFAAGAVRFERAYATAPWTRPSVASMITGLAPGQHGADRVARRLAPRLDTLAEMLAARGWRTGAVVSHFAIGSKAGFDQGYEFFRESEAQGHHHVSTPAVTDQALELLDILSAGPQPFLLFVHYFDPHYNYERHPEVGFAPERGGILDGSEPITRLRRMLDQLGPPEVALLRALYDEEVRYTDAGIGRLLDGLAERGLAERSLVVVTGDHGEEFLERGWLGHTRTLYEELTRVPLMIRAPGVAPRVVERPVSLVSLTPTLLDWLGIDPRELGLTAPSLAPLLRGEGGASLEPVRLEVDWMPLFKPGKRARISAVVDGDWKLIRDEASGRVELYDLASDPRERSDMAASQPERVARLRELLDVGAAEPGPPPEERAPTPEEVELLRGLGYVEAP